MPSVNLSHIIKPNAHYQEFTESGTWVHPEPGVLYAGFVEVIGGGGGGGGGNTRIITSASTNIQNGGQGGQGGKVHRASFMTMEDQDVVVGAGGAKGIGGSVSGSAETASGTAGSVGGLSRFGTMVAEGGAGGQSGSSTPANLFMLRMNYTDVSLGYLQFVNVAGTNGVTDNDTTTARGGTGGTGWKGAGGVGGYGDAVGYTSSGDAIAEDGHMSAVPGGGGGGGGGAVLSCPSATGRTATAGDGGDGKDGIVRVWYWRVTE